MDRVQLGQGVQELGDEPVVEGVPDLGTVQRDPRDGSGEIHFEARVAFHGRLAHMR